MTAGLKFYPSSHRYKIDGQWATGVTTALGVLDKPAISKWAAKSVAEHVADNPAAIEALRNLGRDPLVYALKEVPWSKAKKAADRGTMFHEHAQNYLLGKPVELADDDEQLPLVEYAVQFLEDYGIKPAAAEHVEARVASRTHGYAGTADLFSNGAVWDWKSGKRIYPEAAFQLNAYAFAEFLQAEGGPEQPVPACEAAFGVHIRPDGYDVYPLAFGPEIYEEFLTILRTFRIKKRADGDWKVPGSGYVGVAQANEEHVA